MPGRAYAPLESAAIAVGTVESELSRKTIQHLEGGIVREILVADGDVVRAGQTLIALEDTKARAEAQSLQGQLWEAMAREARLQAEQHGEERMSFPARMEAAQRAESVGLGYSCRPAKPSSKRAGRSFSRKRLSIGKKGCRSKKRSRA